jgi:hypothetical protein
MHVGKNSVQAMPAQGWHHSKGKDLLATAQWTIWQSIHNPEKSKMLPETLEPDNVGKPALAEVDLETLGNWIKTELLEKVKFLYKQDKDLQVNGRLYTCL